MLQRELEESLHRLELENTRLDVSLKHERDKSQQLGRECDEARQVRPPANGLYLTTSASFNITTG